jgi:hypothetical protein
LLVLSRKIFISARTNNIKIHNNRGAERNKNNENKILFQHVYSISFPSFIFNYAPVKDGMPDIQKRKESDNTQNYAETIKLKFIRAHACKSYKLQIRMKITLINISGRLSGFH